MFCASAMACVFIFCDFRAIFVLNRGVNCKKPCLCCYVPRKKLTDITMKYKEHDSEDSKEIFEQAISCRTKERDDCLKKRVYSWSRQEQASFKFSFYTK